LEGKTVGDIHQEGKTMGQFFMLLALLAFADSDVSTGTTLVYEIVPESLSPAATDLTKLAEKVKRRLAPVGSSAIAVDPVPPNRLRIVVPKAAEATLHRIDTLLQRVGTIEFRILANEHDHKALIERALKENRRQLYDDQRQLLAWWVPIARGQEASFQGYLGIVKRTATVEGRTVTEILVVNDVYSVTGEYIQSASTKTDQSRYPRMAITFNASGATLFEALTRANLPDEASGTARKLGIIIDGALHSAPAIRSVIGAQAEITGHFAIEELEDLAAVLNSGSLPVMLRKVSR
jgi:preprotein translocase subunit SecD